MSMPIGPVSAALIAAAASIEVGQRLDTFADVCFDGHGWVPTRVELHYPARDAAVPLMSYSPRFHTAFVPSAPEGDVGRDAEVERRIQDEVRN